MGDVVLVTGGSRGIGAATARLAAARGYDVAVGYAGRQADAEAVVASCRAAGRRAVALAADVADEAAVVAMFDRAQDELGSLTAVVVNAGIVGPQGRLAGMDGARLARMLEVNVLGALLCCREAVRRMASGLGGAGGAIVLVSSMAAVLGSPGEWVDYAASKGAVDTLTVGLAREVAADGIRVNAVRPGLIRTEIHASGGEVGRVERIAPSVPLRRGGEPEEVAAAILWLLSGEASYVTGAILDVSGGR